MANGASHERDSFFRSPMLWGGCGCCLGCLLIPIALISLAGGGAFWAIRQSGIQQEALERVRTHPALIESLGEPIETGWMIEGSINVSPGSGEADYSIPLSGPKGEGRLYVVATKPGNDWQFEELYVVLDGSGQRIDLLSEAHGGVSAPARGQADAEERIVWLWPALGCTGYGTLTGLQRVA